MVHLFGVLKMMDFILSPGTQDNVKACCMVSKSCFL